MRLFKTIAEIKVYWPVVATFDFKDLTPFIDQAERDFIVPYIGQAQYDSLVESYNEIEPGSGDAMTDPELDLLEKIQATLALYANYLWIPSGQLTQGDGGIRIQNTDTLKTAFAWQIENLQRNVFKQAGSAMDALLAFMEENKDDYPDWKNSTAYTQFKDTFIPSSIEFTKLFSALGNSRMNFLAVRPAMMRAEEFVIQAELGHDYYTELKTQNTADNANPANKKIIAMVQKAVAQLTMYRAFTDLSASIDERGIIMLNQTPNRNEVGSKMPAAEYMISKLEKQCLEDGRAYIQMIKDFLKNNIADYATYAASTAYNATTTDTTYKNDLLTNVFFMG